MECVDFLVVGCGPAGAAAAREAARAGLETVVLEKDGVVGAKRVCAAGLRPGFCETFDLPRSIVHCDTPRMALFDESENEHELFFGPGHTSTREELDGTMGRLAVQAGAAVRTQALYRTMQIGDTRTPAIVEYADLRAGVRQRIAARNVFLAPGATVTVDRVSDGDAKKPSALAFQRWRDGLMTTLQYRVYLGAPARAIAYSTMEMHYYRARDGRQIVGWMFPKRDHLTIGLGFLGKMAGVQLRRELDAFVARVRKRIYPDAPVLSVKEEGHLLYGGNPRPVFSDANIMLGGTAAGLVDATTGEGIFEAAMSGRLAAEAAVAQRADPVRAAGAYASRVAARFGRRLRHRVQLMRFLEHRPQRYALLFEQLANRPRFALILQKENFERTLGDRLSLYGHALRFAALAAVVRPS